MFLFEQRGHIILVVSWVQTKSTLHSTLVSASPCSPSLFLQNTHWKLFCSGDSFSPPPSKVTSQLIQHTALFLSTNLNFHSEFMKCILSSISLYLLWFLTTSRTEGNDQQPWDNTSVSAPRDKIAVQISRSAQGFLRGRGTKGRKKRQMGTQ